MNSAFPVRIYLIAIVARLIPVILARGLGIGLDDMFQHDMLARSIASGNGYRWYARDDLELLEKYVNFDLSTAEEYDPARGLYSSFRAPLYPAFLATVYFFSGGGVTRFFSARLAQAIFLGAPLAPLTYHISRNWFPDLETSARTSAVIVAIYPVLLVYPLGLGTENLFFVLLLISTFLLLRSMDHPTAMNFLLAGAFLALTTLTRSIIIPFAASAIVYLMVLHRKPALLTGVAFVILLAPWIARNSLLHHRFVGVESSLGYNLYLGYHPQGNGSFIFGPSLDLMTIMDDSVRDQVGIQKALEFIEAQPDRFFPLAINRLGFFFGLEKRALTYFYSNNAFGYIPQPLLLGIAGLILLPFVAIGLLSVFSLALLKWNEKSILLATLFIAYLLPHVLILSEDRFHLALVPFFAILATQGGRLLFGNQIRTGANRGILLVSVFLALLLLANWGFELLRDADKITALLGPNGNRTYHPY